jgi:hypothetical protein
LPAEEAAGLAGGCLAQRGEEVVFVGLAVTDGSHPGVGHFR